MKTMNPGLEEEASIVDDLVKAWSGNLPTCHGFGGNFYSKYDHLRIHHDIDYVLVTTWTTGLCHWFFVTRR